MAPPPLLYSRLATEMADDPRRRARRDRVRGAGRGRPRCGTCTCTCTCYMLHAHAHAPTAQRCGNTDPASARTRRDAAHHSDALEYKTVQRDSVDRTPQRSVCAFNSWTQLSHWGRGEARRWSVRADTSSHLPISRVGEEVVFALKKARAEMARERERERERDGTREHPRAPESTLEHSRAL